MTPASKPLTPHQADTLAALIGLAIDATFAAATPQKTESLTALVSAKDTAMTAMWLNLASLTQPRSIGWWTP